jgi:hypothetical protein
VGHCLWLSFQKTKQTGQRLFEALLGLWQREGGEMTDLSLLPKASPQKLHTFTHILLAT